jgi:hypothetical protein
LGRHSYVVGHSGGVGRFGLSIQVEVYLLVSNVVEWNGVMS